MFTGKTSTKSDIGIRLLDKIPESGQFVVVWIHDGETWSDTYQHDNDGELMIYISESDDFEYFTDGGQCWQRYPESIATIIQAFK